MQQPYACTHAASTVKGPKTHVKNLSSCGGILPSKQSAVLNKIYLRSTQNSDFKRWAAAPSDDSMGEVFNIGHKSTKHLPFRYKQAPMHSLASFTYGNDFCRGGLESNSQVCKGQKNYHPVLRASDSELNKELAATFSRTHNGHSGAPLVHPGSYAAEFDDKSKGWAMSATNPGLAAATHPTDASKRRPKPELLRTNILGSGDQNLVKTSSTQRVYSAHDLKLVSRDMRYENNLSLSADCGDCYKSTYGTMTLDLARASSAPAGMGRKGAERRMLDGVSVTYREMCRTRSLAEQLLSDDQLAGRWKTLPNAEAEKEERPDVGRTRARPGSSSCVDRRTVFRNIATRPGY